MKATERSTREGAGVGGEVAGWTWVWGEEGGGGLEWHEELEISIGQSDQPDRH